MCECKVKWQVKKIIWCDRDYQNNNLFCTVNNWTWWTDFYRYEAWSAACTRYYYLSLSIFTTKWKLKDCGTISSQGKVM